VASGGSYILVSSTSLKKSNIGWPQQPSEKKVLKFNIIFPDSAKTFFFSKYQNKAEFEILDDSEVLSSDFPGLRTYSASTTSTASVASMAITASFHPKNCRS
jgi:hypothetical protein